MGQSGRGAHECNQTQANWLHTIGVMAVVEGTRLRASNRGEAEIPTSLMKRSKKRTSHSERPLATRSEATARGTFKTRAPIC